MRTATALDVEKLQAARVWLTRGFPYLAVALHSVVLRSAPGYGTFGVDRHWRLYVDPACVDAWTVEQVGSVLVHEVWHLLRAHADRCERSGAADRPRAWNIAADAEINDDLVTAGLPLPGMPVLPKMLGLPDGLLAEEYFSALRVEVDVDCGSGADARAREHEDGAPSAQAPGLTQVQGDLVRIAVAKELRDTARTAGNLPAGWARWAEGVLSPKVDWRPVLAATVRRGLAAAAGQVDYTYARPSRRATTAPGLVLPALRRPVPTVAVVVDTSGSVDDEMLGQALAEVDGALQAGGVRRNGVTVLSCDAGVGAAQRVRSAAQVQLVGGGGTDLRVGIAVALGLRPTPDVIVVLTDGFTPWPDGPPRGARLVVALLDARAPEPPAWATTVRAHD